MLGGGDILTIKRRLHISNFLMLGMPIIITIIISFCVVFILMGFTNVSDFRSFRDGRAFDNAMYEVEQLSQDWANNSNLDSVKADVDSFNKKYASNEVYVTVYDENGQIYPSESLTSPLVSSELQQEDKYILVVDKTAIYKITAKPYTVVLACDNYLLNHHRAIGGYYYIGILLPISLIIIIYLTNRMLTQFVFKSIVTPIDILVYGVNQICDGNLAYRIVYDKKDEFAEICSDFNDMANRLSELVNARQRDEQSRRELIAGISHDLRTPLTSIKAYVEGLEKGVASSPQVQKRYFDTIKSKTSDLEYIINQLFLFTKLDVGEFPLRMEQIDIGQELSTQVELFQNEYLQKGLSIHIRNNVQNAFVKIDVIQFRNVIQNILENSVKYKKEEFVDAEISCIDNESEIIIKIADNGPGVPSEALEKLFELFYRNDPSRENPSNGSGLGLATAKKIITMFDGEIRAENVPGGGLVIIITLPKEKRGDNF